MAEQKVKLTELPAATDTIDTAQLLINQNSTDQKIPVTHFLRAKNNLSDIPNSDQARANLSVPSVDEVNDKLAGFINGSYTFTAGGSLASLNDFIWDEESKSWYYWTGDLPKYVPAASDPDSAGGISKGAWAEVGDATLRSMLASSTGTSLIGMPAGGTLAETIHTVSVEQFGAVGDGVTDNASSIQDAINWVHKHGGGKVFLGNGEYMSGPLTLKSKVIIEGQSYQTTKLKAISGWNSQSFIISDGFNDYSTASPIPPGCFSAGLRNICINGNKSGFGGSPSKLSGNGVMIAGSNTVMENVMIIYVPSVGLVTQDYGQNDGRAGYMAANPDMGWMIIPTFKNIRIQFCGNDCWHCESQDAFIDDVEIVGAGYGSTPSADLRSFWEPTQRVADFRVWRAVTLGFIHCYGNYNGYGIVAGRGNSTAFMRFQYEQIIVESCMVNLWMMRDAVPSGGRIDSHQGTGDASIPIHGSFVRVPINIIDVNNSDISDLGSIYINQKDPAHNGIYLILNGQNYSVQNINITRSPLVSDALSGTGVYLTGSNIRIESGIIKGFFGTNSESVPSSGFVAAGGSGNYVNMTCSFSNYGFRSHSADVLTGGRIECITVSNPFYGFETYAVRNRSRIMMKSGNSGNTISGITSVINSGITTVQTIEATGLTLPYTPLPEEVSATLAVTAFSGSSIIPTSYVIIYDQGASTVNKLVFRIQLQNSTSPMQAVIRWKLN